MINIYGARVSLYITPARILNISVSPSGVMALAYVSLYMIAISFTNSSGIPYAFSIKSIFPLCTVSVIKAYRFLSFTPSIKLL